MDAYLNAVENGATPPSRYKHTNRVVKEFHNLFSELQIYAKRSTIPATPEESAEMTTERYTEPNIRTQSFKGENIQIRGIKLMSECTEKHNQESKIVRINYIDSSRALARNMHYDPYSQCRRNGNLVRGFTNKYAELMRDPNNPIRNTETPRPQRTNIFFCQKGTKKRDIISRRKEMLRESVIEEVKEFALCVRIWGEVVESI